MSDPLDELRRAWDDWDVAAPPDELERNDPGTRASVEWLQRAWRVEAEAPPAELLWRLRARRRDVRRPRLRPVALAVLAGLAAALFLVVRLGHDATEVGPAPPADAGQSAGAANPTSVAHGPTSVAREPGPAASLASLSLPPERFRSRPDGVELVSGSVRLVLVQPAHPTPFEGSFASPSEATDQETFR